MNVIYSINGKYFKDYGVYISKSKGLLDKPKPKKKKQYDWAEYHGKATDLSPTKYEERTIELSGWIEGEDWATMKNNFQTLFSEFDHHGLVRLLIEYGKELAYDVYLDGETELEKQFRQGRQFGFFTLKLKEPSPIKRTFKLTGNQLNLSFNARSWVEISIDGEIQTEKGRISLQKTLQNRAVGKNAYQGRNLALNSKSERQGIGTNKSWELLKTDAYIFSESQKVGEYYTVSFLAKATGSQRRFTPYISGTQRIGDFVLSNEFRPYTATYRAETQFNHIHFYGFGITDLRVKDFKIEKGNHPTDWAPAPEDTHYITIAGNLEDITDLTTNAEEI